MWSFPLSSRPHFLIPGIKQKIIFNLIYDHDSVTKIKHVYQLQQTFLTNTVGLRIQWKPRKWREQFVIRGKLNQCDEISDIADYELIQFSEYRYRTL